MVLLNPEEIREVLKSGVCNLSNRGLTVLPPEIGQLTTLRDLMLNSNQLATLPPEISEGKFGFFSRDAVNALPLPETDRSALWPIYDRYRDRFVALRADCMPGKPVQVDVEEITPA